jgi:hypothetical protein
MPTQDELVAFVFSMILVGISTTLLVIVSILIYATVGQIF